MTGLDATGRAANVIGSLQAYIWEKFDSASGEVDASHLPIDYGGGQSFSDTELSEWLQFRVTGNARPPRLLGRYGNANDRGQELFWLLNLNVFVRPKKQTSQNNLRVWGLRDVILGEIHVGRTIEVRDHVGTGETIGVLFVDEVMADRQVFDNTRVDLVQHNLVFALRWSEKWTMS